MDEAAPVETAEQQFAFLALNDSDPEVRMQAVGEVKDPDVLGQIAQSDDDASIRLVAVRKVKDQRILFEIARRDTDAKVRTTAVKRIKDQDLLEQLAIPPRLDVCLAAIGKLKDQDRLMAIACDHTLTPGGHQGGSTALGRSIRSEALDAITDDEQVMDVAMGVGLHPDDRYIGLRREAVWSLRDLKLLRRIADESPDSRIASTAQEWYDEIRKRINR